MATAGGAVRLRLITTSCTILSRRCSASLCVTCFCACEGRMKGSDRIVVVSGMFTSAEHLIAEAMQAASRPGYSAARSCPAHRNTRRQFSVRPAAIAHIVVPTMTSSTTQARGLENTGANRRAPNPRTMKKLNEASAAAMPNAH